MWTGWLATPLLVKQKWKKKEEDCEYFEGNRGKNSGQPQSTSPLLKILDPPLKNHSFFKFSSVEIRKWHWERSFSGSLLGWIDVKKLFSVGLINQLFQSGLNSWTCLHVKLIITMFFGLSDIMGSLVCAWISAEQPPIYPIYLQSYPPSFPSLHGRPDRRLASINLNPRLSLINDKGWKGERKPK